MRHAITLLVAGLSCLFVAGCSSDGSTTATTAAPGDTSNVVDTSAPTAGAAQRMVFTAKDGTEIQYVLLVPEGRRQGVPGKVIFAFPPGGQDIDLAAQLVDEKYRDEAIARDFVVVSPAAPSGGLYYSDGPAALVPELLDAVVAMYPPEGGKFDLVGVSNGGLSAFRAAIAMPERFRSLVVFPGYSPDGADDPNLAKLAGIGVAMFVGGDDGGWREASETTEARLKAQRNTVELHVVEGQGHILGDALPGSDLFDALERVRG
ncbi:MAG: alpha/beta hydrolase-fold protein [Ilumatobacteraceae bacterium]